MSKRQQKELSYQKSKPPAARLACCLIRDDLALYQGARRPIADPRGKGPILGPFTSIFMPFSAKILPNNK